MSFGSHALVVRIGSMAVVGLAAMVLSGCVSAPKYVIEDGRIVVDSPFDLEIGSTEYAKALGFTQTYIPTEFCGFYEKYGYSYVKDIVNYGGGTDRLYVKEL